MFCPECGAKNLDDSLYCSECGTRLVSPVNETTQQQSPKPTQGGYENPKPFHEGYTNTKPDQGDYTYIKPNQKGYTNTQPSQESTYAQPAQMGYTYKQPTQPSAQVPRKPMKIIHKIMLVELIVAGLLVICFYNVGRKAFSPERTAERYFIEVMNGDWESVYNYLDRKESQFITKKNFISTLKNQDPTDYNTYKIGKANNDMDNLGTSVDISYRVKGSSDNQDYTVVLNKQGKKNFYLFDSWKVDPSSYICNDYTLTVPSGVKVKFNDTQLNEEYLSSEENGYASYVIPELFHGEYQITLTQENMEDYTTTISTYDGQYYLDQMILKNDVQKELIQTAGNTMKQIYDAGFKEAAFDTIADLFTEDKVIRAEMESNYSDFCYTIGDNDEIGLQKVDFSNVSGTASYETIDGALYVYVTLNYDYTATYGITDWLTYEITTNTYSDYGSNDYTFLYENGKWNLTSADFDAIYY